MKLKKLNKCQITNSIYNTIERGGIKKNEFKKSH